MINVGFRIVELQKRYPLTISRGTQATSDNLFVTVQDGRHTGIGELSPATSSQWTGIRGREQLEAFVADGVTPSPHETYDRMRERHIDPPAMAALDVALWDLLGKQAGQPLYRIFGLPRTAAATSVTIGIETPEVIRQRVPEILSRTGAKRLKIKLGSPDGTESDMHNFAAAQESSETFHVKLRVDANGGWSVEGARRMMRWLADRGVDYVEQPLAEGMESELPAIFKGRPFPIFLDESCRFSQDVPRLADRCDGVNLKLMKCGGLTEAIRIVAAARAHGLKTMIGCMSESSVAISAGASISALFDHIDLDSHLNLNPDPAAGAEIVDGVVLPSESPGHGASLRNA